MSKELFKTNESLEMYVETIYLLSQDSPKVKMSEVASNLGVTKPSCHKAMAQLKDKGYILQEKYGDIELTEVGRTLGKDVYLRHQLLTYYLIHALNVTPMIAESDACRMEHVLSDETIESIKRWVSQHQNENN